MTGDPIHEEVPVIVSAFVIIDGVEAPMGGPREGMISRGALDLLHGQADEAPLVERRQRAWEAAYDEIGPNNVASVGRCATAIEAAIETATRVRVAPEIERAAELAAGDTIHDYDPAEMRRVLIAAFRAAGFEVEE